MRDPIGCPRCGGGGWLFEGFDLPLVECDFCDFWATPEASRIIHGLQDANRAEFDSLNLYHEALNDRNQERMP